VDVDGAGGSEGVVVVSVVAGVVVSSAASELAGARSRAAVSASAASGRSACFEGRGLIDQLPSR
jgi:hypothetical protein